MAKKIKKTALALTLTLAITTAFSGCSSKDEEINAKEIYGTDTLKVFNWGEYIGENVIADFEEKYGVTVVYELFDSNEMMYTKVQAGDVYDILIPSDYTIERLIKNDMLATLDKSLLPNLENLTDEVKNLPYDTDNTYSAPYFWGSVGIVYNKNNVPTELIEEQGFDILKNTDYKSNIYMYDSERDSFMVALKALGYSMNTENETEIQEAYDWLAEQAETMDPAYVTDEIIDSMITEVKDLGVMYSGDAAYALSENENLAFCMPHQGTNLWSDAMVIPKDSEAQKLAHEFINFVLSYDASLDNSSYVGYTSSNKEVVEFLSSEEGDYFENEAYLPRNGYEKDEVFKYNEVLKEKLTELWIKVKAN